MLFISLAPLVVLLAAGARAAVTTNASLAAGQTFDYIVVGGGLTGITVAARLAENSSVSVLLVEAGADNRNDPRVYDIHRYGDALKSELDWSWPTEKGGMHGCVTRRRTRRSSLKCDRTYSGKTLGGGTSINGATWTRGSAAQYDAWQSLLEASEASLGWNWADLSSYMRRVCVADVGAQATRSPRSAGRNFLGPEQRPEVKGRELGREVFARIGRTFVL